MTSGPDDFHARCGGLRQPSYGDILDLPLGAVDGPFDRAFVGRQQALRGVRLAEGTLGRSGA
jgi:hypothetical protein